MSRKNKKHAAEIPAAGALANRVWVISRVRCAKSPSW